MRPFRYALVALTVGVTAIVAAGPVFAGLGSLGGGTAAGRTRSVEVDTAPLAVTLTTPTITVTAPAAGATTGPTITVTIASVPAAAAYECTLDAAAFACTASTPLTGLSNGTHTLTVRGRNAVGDAGPTVDRTWTVDGVTAVAG